MVEIRILQGSRSGAVVSVNRFPFTIGRVSKADLSLSDPGVWDEHAVLKRESATGFHIARQGSARVLIDGVSVESQRLSNGDLIECGSARFRFCVSAPLQKSGHWMTWAFVGLFAIVVASEFFLISYIRP